MFHKGLFYKYDSTIVLPPLGPVVTSLPLPSLQIYQFYILMQVLPIFLATSCGNASFNNSLMLKDFPAFCLIAFPAFLLVFFLCSSYFCTCYSTFFFFRIDFLAFLLFPYFLPPFFSFSSFFASCNKCFINFKPHICFCFMFNIF